MILLFLGACQGSRIAASEQTNDAQAGLATTYFKETQTAQSETTNTASTVKTQVAATQTQGESYVTQTAAASSEMFNQLRQVCFGQQVAGAAQYVGVGIHPVALIDVVPDESMNYGMYGSWRGDYIPIQWAATSIEDAQLVACIGETESVLLETCNYDQGLQIYRYSVQIEIQLFEAAAGQLISKDVLVALPDECQPTLLQPASGVGVNNFYYGFITGDDLQNWLKPYVVEE